MSGGGGTRWSSQSVAILEDEHTHLVASSTRFHADRKSVLLLPANPADQAGEASTTSTTPTTSTTSTTTLVEKCASACIRLVGEGNVDAVTLTPPAPYTLPACHCYKTDLFCVAHAVAKFGVPKSMIKDNIKKCSSSSFSHTTIPVLSKNTCPNCGRGSYCKRETYEVGQAEDKGKCVACVSDKEGFFYTSCNADSSQKPCPPCPSGEYRRGCSGTSRGECVRRRTCTGVGEFASITSAFRDTDCVSLSCPVGTEPSRQGTCAPCPAGKKREMDLLFRDRDEEVLLGFDLRSNRPMFSSLRGKIGNLKVSEDAYTSNGATRLTPSYGNVYKFNEEGGTEHVFLASIAVGWMSANGVFSAASGRSVDVLFFNSAVPLMCTA